MMEWFRWHHGSVSDPKFQLVARKAQASVAEVIAVWATLLERASAADDRGSFGSLDHEATDFALGLEDGKARRILQCMCDRGLIDIEKSRVNAWERRQVKREREDHSTERSRASRARNRDGDATPCNATQRQETPREDERRREEKVVPANAGTSGEPDCGLPPCPHLEVIALFHEQLPVLARVVANRWKGSKSEAALRARWKEGLASGEGFWSFKSREEGLEKFRELFQAVADSDFLCGRVRGKTFRADLHWLLVRTNFDKVVSDRYVNEEAAS